VSFQYDQLNRLTNMVDAAGTTKYTYTAGDQLSTEVQPFANSTLTSTYVNRLRTAVSLQQPTGTWTNKFVYDAAARLTNVTSPAGVFSYALGGASSASSLIKKLLLPNASYITNKFDNVARLSGTYLDNSGNSVLDSAAYGYNKANQRTAFTNTAGTYVLYSYDNIGQVKVATSSVSSENRGYTYDSAWNLNYLTNNGTLETFTVDSRNQLTGDPNAPTDSYDANGNLQIRQWSGLLYYAYTNDDENHLTWVQYDDYGASPPLWLTQFVYDGFGRMRKRIEYTYNAGGNPIWSSETHYIYDGARVIQERDTNNTPTVSYTRGTDLSGTLESAGGIGGLLARSSGYSGGNWSTHHFYHADGNGNITYLVDSSQAMAATYRYDPFGNTISSSGTQASANVYRFSSKEVHANSGMYMYLYRFYDPTLQRWLNWDPLGEIPEINLFGFVQNAPTNYVDALGLLSFKDWLRILAMMIWTMTHPGSPPNQPPRQPPMPPPPISVPGCPSTNAPPVGPSHYYSYPYSHGTYHAYPYYDSPFQPNNPYVYGPIIPIPVLIPVVL
jgi:RHS repeat-associated protein